jgi:hypothetical protein
MVARRAGFLPGGGFCLKFPADALDASKYATE